MLTIKAFLVRYLYILSKKYLPSWLRKTLCYIMLAIILAILFIIIIIIYLKFFDQPALLEAKEGTFVHDMDNGIIPRTPLLQPGQTVKTLTHGIYPVTGGYINIGYLGSRSKVTKIISIIVDDDFSDPTRDTNYHPDNEPFNTNFAKVLYEIRATGKESCYPSNLDSRSEIDSMTISYYKYLMQFKASTWTGIKGAEVKELRITDKFLDALAQQRNNIP